MVAVGLAWVADEDRKGVSQTIGAGRPERGESSLDLGCAPSDGLERMQLVIELTAKGQAGRKESAGADVPCADGGHRGMWSVSAYWS